jgi:hypothetical protein
VEKLPKVKPNQPFSKLISVSSSEKVAQNFWSLKFFLKKTQSKQLHNGRKFWSPWAIAMTNALHVDETTVSAASDLRGWRRHLQRELNCIQSLATAPTILF